MRPVLGSIYTSPINPNACTIWPGGMPVLHHLSYIQATAEQTKTQPLFLMHFNTQLRADSTLQCILCVLALSAASLCPGNE